VGAGELFGLVGPDGAGKTTVMRLLAAILDPTGGDAWVDGHHTVREEAAIKDAIGYMSQRFGLYADLTVLENLLFYADIYGVPRRHRAATLERLFAFSALAPFKQRLAGNLSGGMKQKLALACALIHTPRVLFLDEPTNGVDPLSRREFWRILDQLIREGVTIFISTAYLDEAERCARLALLHRGRLLALGTPAEVKRLMPGAILDLHPAEPRRAASLLRAGLPDCAIGLFGDRLHVATPDPAATQPRAAALLRDAGLDVPPMQAVPPTLEDVFVAVLARAEAGAGHE
jgi:ABC-2 type transport system ATP-binding protein